MKMSQMKKALAKTYSNLGNCTNCGIIINGIQYDKLGIPYKAKKCTDCAAA